VRCGSLPRASDETKPEQLYWVAGPAYTSSQRLSTCTVNRGSVEGVGLARAGVREGEREGAKGKGRAGEREEN